MTKYEFTGETKVFLGVTMHRIRAVAKLVFPSGRVVNVGDIGGWIEKEDNLDHYGNAWVYGDAKVCGNAKVYGNAWVYGDAKVYGNAWVYGDAKVYGNACVYGDAKVYGNAKVYGDAKVCGNADVSKSTHLLQIGAVGSRDSFITFFRTKDKDIKVRCGCFYGTIKAFIVKVKDTHGESRHANVYQKAAELAVAQIEDVDEKEGTQE